MRPVISEGTIKCGKIIIKINQFKLKKHKIRALNWYLIYKKYPDCFGNIAQNATYLTTLFDLYLSDYLADLKVLFDMRSRIYGMKSQISNMLYTKWSHCFSIIMIKWCTVIAHQCLAYVYCRNCFFAKTYFCTFHASTSRVNI